MSQASPAEQILLDALATAHGNACSCCNSSDEVYNYCHKAIEEYNKLKQLGNPVVVRCVPIKKTREELEKIYPKKSERDAAGGLVNMLETLLKDPRLEEYAVPIRFQLSVFKSKGGGVC